MNSFFFYVQKIYRHLLNFCFMSFKLKNVFDIDFKSIVPSNPKSRSALYRSVKIRKKNIFRWGKKKLCATKNGAEKYINLLLQAYRGADSHEEIHQFILSNTRGETISYRNIIEEFWKDPTKITYDNYTKYLKSNEHISQEKLDKFLENANSGNDVSEFSFLYGKQTIDAPLEFIYKISNFISQTKQYETTLKTLDLWENELDDGFVKQFPYNKVPNLVNLGLNQNKITGKGFSFILSQICQQKNVLKQLRRLSMRYNPLGDWDGETIKSDFPEAPLPWYSRLFPPPTPPLLPPTPPDHMEIILSNCNIDYDGLKCLASLKKVCNLNLCYLDLQENPFDCKVFVDMNGVSHFLKNGKRINKT